MISTTSSYVTLAASTLLALALGACGRNAPGPQDDVVVNAPGVVAKADENGVAVKAPLGVEVNVGQQGVVVKAPGVDVKADENGVAVDAPFVSVRTGETTTATK